ncbi:hypothetical protein HDV00_001636 [Rhizophlyctis rosea]|nr:hypothetical protein HDV00_001636 [Rhizophlyctis rosea]
MLLSSSKISWKEASTSEIDLTNAPVSAESFQAVLEYLYTENLPELIIFHVMQLTETTTVDFIIGLYETLDYLLVPSGVTDLTTAFASLFQQLPWHTIHDWFNNPEFTKLTSFTEAIIPILAKWLRDGRRTPAQSTPLLSKNAGHTFRTFDAGLVPALGFPPSQQEMQNVAQIIHDPNVLMRVAELAWMTEAGLNFQTGTNTMKVITFVDCWRKMHPDEASSVQSEIFNKLIDICMRSPASNNPEGTGGEGPFRNRRGIFQ